MCTDDVQLWPDEKLLVLMQSDDQAAFEQIYNRYWSKLYLSAYNIVRDRQAAEDIVQDVLVSLWMRRNSLVVDSLNSYLYTAVRYQVFKIIRAGQMREAHSYVIENPAVVNVGESALMTADMDRLLEKGVTELPEKCRQIFLLSRKKHLSTKEIANWLGIAPKTVENQITIALNRLRTTLGDFLLWTAVSFINGWF
ncbi:RNA polymerase sigma-70 factor [Adhaeribacter rhizoryzae]|uniref:RNA polymerase sigma-70 factor n=1 Tax=Adhaeribacter rhizoryzae TaxID=2607907 RepID=A0A5M6DAH0_9BACT|nr:RNA polymerase sigma-70 factor [Adhaeribacter rhizoryzae]KAA5542979.1 RNA polymerase sigma-70 factor [Adhaeribacter rhizoryzae]